MAETDHSSNPWQPEHGSPVQIVISRAAQHRIRRWFWICLALAVVLYLAYLVREIWLPLLLAFMIAMVLDPVVDRMERRGWPRGWAALLIFCGFFATVAGILYFAVPAVIHQAEAISAQVSPYIPAPGQEKQAQSKLTAMLNHSHAPAYVKEAVKRGSATLSFTLRRSTTWIAEHAMDLLSNLIWLVVIPIVTFYSLKDFHLIFAKSLLLVPRERRDLVQTLVAEVTTIFARFLRGLMLVSFLNGIATWLLLLALRVPNAFTLGAIAGTLYSIPYLGALMTILLVAGVSFLSGGLKFMLLVVALNILLHQVIFDQLITPRVLGGHVGLHPLLSIVALLAGNVLLGILGMILAVPIAACIQLLVITLVPKLAHDIALPADPHQPPDTVAGLAEETKSAQIATDATEALHRSVSQAVEHVEAKQDEAQHSEAA